MPERVSRMDIERIEALIDIIKDARVTELTVKKDGSGVTLRKSPRSCVQVVLAPQAVVQEAPKEAAPDHEAGTALPTGPVVFAPMVGIFHAVDGIAKPGTQVKKGQVVGIIESMKLMNDVVSDTDGNVAEVYVEDGMPVEYGQVLFRLEEQ